MTEFFRPTHRRWIAGIVGVIVLLLMIASCVPARPVAVGYAPVQQAPVMTAPAVVGAAPVVVAPAPAVVHHDSGFGSAFAGSMLGSMIGNSFGGGRSTHTTVVERHTAPAPVTTTAPAQRYATPTPPAQRYTPPSTSSWSNSRGVTSTVTSRPSTFGSTSGRTSISVGRRR